MKNNNKRFSGLKSFYEITRAYKKQFLAVTIAISTIFGTGGCGKDNKEEENSIYLVDLTDKYEDEAILYDSKTGKKISMETDDNSKLLALVMDEETDKDEFYETIIINEQGKMIKGLMNGKYLDDDAIDQMKIDENVFEEISRVFADGGLYLLNDYNNLDNSGIRNCVVKEDAYVATTSDFKVTPNNNYHWKRAVYVANRKIHSGYLASDYTYGILDDDTFKLIGNKYKVNSDALLLRAEPSTDSGALLNLYNGTDVIELSFSERKIIDDKEWCYVAVPYKGEIKRGYVCATDYSNSTPTHYLVTEEEYKEETYKYNNDKEEEQDDVQTKIFTVDGSSDDCNHVNLRELPTLDSTKIAELENGTLVYIDSNADFDNTKWAKISTADGTLGYVSTSFLFDKDTNKSLKEELEGKEEDKNINETLEINESKYGTYKIIDVSEHNRDIDFSKVKESGIDAVIIRMFDSFFMDYDENILSYDDSKYVEYAKECENNNIPYGLYVYSRATTEKMAQQEALKVLRFASKHQLKPTFPIYWDIEPQESQPLYDEDNNKVNSLEFISNNPEQVLNNFYAFAKVLEDNGYEAGIYSNDATLCRIDPEGSNLVDYSVWDAKYYYAKTTCDFVNNYYAQDLDYKGDVAIYQFSETGKIDGIDGTVDCSHGKYDYSQQIIDEYKNVYLSMEEVDKVTQDVLAESISMQKVKN